jgi:uncharacterized protein (DUF2141 family)
LIRRRAFLPLLMLLTAADLPEEGDPGYIRSTPELGKKDAQCREPEYGPAILITVEGLKDRKGNLKSEIYPSNDDDFLEDDNKLVMAGKTFRRIEAPVAQTGPIELCIRIPGPGTYSLILLHDRDSNRKIGLSTDGFGFPTNPKIGLLKRPKSADASIEAGNGLTRVSIIMNYRRGLLSFGPLKR